jgi:hypothetical protein
MEQTLADFAIWLRATPVSAAIRLTPWLWPVCEIVHFFGLSLLVGIVGFFDLRLLGCFTPVPVSAAWSLIRWAKVGFALSALTGVTFFVGAPDQYVNNVAFFVKLLFLAIAGVNAAWFERTYAASLTRPDPASAVLPPAVKVIAVVSLVSWLMVIYWGRMLPFVGNAF